MTLHKSIQQISTRIIIEIQSYVKCTYVMMISKGNVSYSNILCYGVCVTMDAKAIHIKTIDFQELVVHFTLCNLALTQNVEDTMIWRKEQHLKTRMKGPCGKTKTVNVTFMYFFTSSIGFYIVGSPL